MAFWGIEVKPGKPFTHFCEKARGRLHISQATLGISDETKKSLLQCNVGSRSPVLLCALLPNSTESCHLDLEFEEADDVVFSVIGPRSIYLTGYYVLKSQQLNAHSDTESYGVDIENSHTEGSNYSKDDDEYEDSFIDDGELQVSPPSPISSGREMDQDTPDNDTRKNRQGSTKKIKKKYQVSDSESEEEDGYLLSVFKDKKLRKSIGPDDGKESSQVILQKDDTTEKVGCKSQSNNDKLKRGEKLPLHNIGVKVKDKKKKLRKEMETHGEATSDLFITEDNHHANKAEDNNINHNIPVDCSENQIQTLDVMKVKKRKERSKETKKVSEIETATNLNTLKKKVKKKKTGGDGKLNVSMLNGDNLDVKYEDQTMQTMAKERTLPDGFIVEEVACGPHDGKVATPGKKVKIYYSVMLKDSGHVFDSNVGKTAFKFLLGDKGVIEGWNIGVDGMRVGDKRRLTIPPSMGYGDHGAGENIPPNSVLVYDIELASVRG